MQTAAIATHDESRRIIPSSPETNPAARTVADRVSRRERLGTGAANRGSKRRGAAPGKRAAPFSASGWGLLPQHGGLRGAIHHLRAAANHGPREVDAARDRATRRNRERVTARGAEALAERRDLTASDVVERDLH